MSHYLITGNQGFIGKNLAGRIISLGHTFVGLEKTDLGKEDWQKNILDIFTSNKFDGIYHVGACSDTLEQDVNYMMFLNYEVTRFISDVAKKFGIKIVYSSSAACYGTDGSNPANLYAWSKYAGEQYIKAAGTGVSLRYFNVFGPGEENKGRMASVAYQSYKKYYVDKSVKEIELFPLRPQRDFIHVDDVVSANIWAMEKCEAGNVYDVGTTTPVDFETFMNEFGIPYTYTTADSIPHGYQFYTRANPEKIIPGWSPKSEIKSRIRDYKKYLDNREWK
jgi:ADP-L-glycero-D-manno-heptose 6-epimerase